MHGQHSFHTALTKLLAKPFCQRLGRMEYTCLSLQVPSGHTRELVDQLVATQALHLKEEYGHLEKDLAVSIADHSQKANHVMATESQTKLLSLLCMLPHGVIKWSHAVPGTC